MVVADNCSDRTEAVAGARAPRSSATVDNAHKKAGALNQALGVMLPGLDDDDLVLVMDADSLLDPGFLEAARGKLDGSSPPHQRHRRELGGVGGTFRGGPGGGLLGTFQRNEYARYARDVRRLKGKALVLTGTASVFRVRVLREVQAGPASGALPDKSGAGAVYDTHVLTEDNELSLALMHLGTDRRPGRVHARDRGHDLLVRPGQAAPALEARRGREPRLLRPHPDHRAVLGPSGARWPRRARDGALPREPGLGCGRGLTLNPFWIAASAIFVLERVVTVRSRGWRQMLLAAPLVVEMVYDVFLQLVQAQALAQSLLRHERKW